MIKFEVDRSIPPPGGWVKPTCTFESHKWALEIEDGHAHIHCCDPCDPSAFDPSAGQATCASDLWNQEDFHTPGAIPVRLTYVDDSTPSTPAGPAEYGFYIEVRAS